MKEKFAAMLWAVVLFLLLASGCRGVSSYLQPKLDPNECWISTDPPIYFVGWDEENQGQTGEIVLSDGSRIPIVVEFDFGIGVDISRLTLPAELAVVHGKCQFSRDKVVVTVTMDNENWLDGAETITFVRQDRETAVLP